MSPGELLKFKHAIKQKVGSILATSRKIKLISAASIMPKGISDEMRLRIQNEMNKRNEIIQSMQDNINKLYKHIDSLQPDV